MKLYVGLLLVYFNAFAMDLDDSKKAEIGQLIAREPKPKPVWEGFFVLNPLTRAYMNTQEYHEYSKPNGLAALTNFLKRVSSKAEFVPLIGQIFAVQPDFEKTWVAQSMLLYAIDTDSTATVENLLKLRVNADKISTFFTQFWDGHLPLNLAVKRRNPAMVTLLLNAGADPNAYDCYGQEGTALMVALESYFVSPDAKIDTDIINLLLKYKARPAGQTLLFIKHIKYSSLPSKAISRHLTYKHWEQNKKLAEGKDICASCPTELAQELCLDNWVEAFKKLTQQ